MASEEKCKHCGRTTKETRLTKCPICFDYFCDDHAYLMSGRTFCGRGCAQHFFFGEEGDG